MSVDAQKTTNGSARKRSQQVVANVLLILLAFAAGMVTGVQCYPELFAAKAAVDDHGHDHGDAHADSHEHDHDDHDDADHEHDEANGENHRDEEDHLDLTEQAVANLELKLGEVEVGEYWKQAAFPGEVVEIPGQSGLSVAASVAGVIEQVMVRDGQSVELGDELFELRITDPLVTTAQVELLEVLAKLEVNRREIERLRPLASEGLVGKNRKRELEYEVEKLEAQRQAKSQEILARGLPPATLEHVMRTRELTKRILIALPRYVLGERSTTNQITKQVGVSGKTSYSVNHIETHPGQAVQAGQHLCSLSYHGELYIRGQAFESDVAAINQMCEQKWGISAEFGHQHHEGHQHIHKKEGLQIARIDNHVSSEGLFSFFVPIANEVTQEFRSQGRLYQQWKFRPGQRVHLRMPLERFENKIKLPVEAVAVSGPNAVVFRKHAGEHGDEVSEEVGLAVGIGIAAVSEDDDHDHDHHEDHQHDHYADHDHPHDDHPHDDDPHDDDHDHAYLQLEPVPVHVLHRGHDFVVIEPGGELHVGDEVAMNAAYKLQLALQTSAGGGGGHSHGHEH